MTKPHLTRDSIVNSLTELVMLFRKGDSAKDFHWWNASSIFDSSYGYAAGQPMLETAIAGIKSLNPVMLGKDYIKHQLIWEFLEKQTISVNQDTHLYGDGLTIEARRILDGLCDFTAWQDVDVPIANLLIGSEPSTFLGVTFFEETKDELERWAKNLKVFWHDGASRAYAVARVRSPGDRSTAIRYARDKIDTVLEVMRAFCFPFGHEILQPVAVVGDFIPYTSTPVRIGSQFLSMVGQPTMLLNLRKDILGKLDDNQRKLIENHYQKTNYNSMGRKLLYCVHWLAESTKPDRTNAKFLKISVALESLIGGEPQEEELKVRGITAMLAERAAFIAGANTQDRISIDKDIRKYYKIRGGIVHTGEPEVKLKDVNGFGQLVRRVALSLLEKMSQLGDEIGEVDKLQNWVTSKRYSLPEEPTL